MDNGLRRRLCLMTGPKMPAGLCFDKRRSSGPQEAATSPLLSLLTGPVWQKCGPQGDITLHNRPICRPGWSLEPPGCAAGEIRLQGAVASWKRSPLARPRALTVSHDATLPGSGPRPPLWCEPCSRARALMVERLTNTPGSLVPTCPDTLTCTTLSTAPVHWGRAPGAQPVPIVTTSC